MSFRIVKLGIAAASMSLVLGACGGGGVSGTAAPAAAAVPTAPLAPVVGQNVPPVADAGIAQSVFVGAMATLDGSRSTDADSDALTYRWAISSKPAGSSVKLSSSTALKPTFTPDLAGDYVASLVVNDGKADSVAATVKVTASVLNLAPVANAGPAQKVVTGSVVSLNGAGSTDPNGDAITYAWTLSVPSGSAATLSNANTAIAQFTADVVGAYAATLVVSDGTLSSAPATVSVTAAAANVAPVANAGSNRTIPSSVAVTLNGSASTDANGDTLTYLWSLTSVPAGSAASLSSTTTVNPSFTPDVVGNYVAQLIVNDGKVNSAPVTVSDRADAQPCRQWIVRGRACFLELCRCAVRFLSRGQPAMQLQRDHRAGHGNRIPSSGIRGDSGHPGCARQFVNR